MSPTTNQSNSGMRTGLMSHYLGLSLALIRCRWKRSRLNW
jgi:hypothetical protein